MARTLSYRTVAPRRYISLMRRDTALTLPGIMRELMTTVSPLRMLSWRWPPSTMRDSADNGSPWAPVTTSTSCSSGRSGTPLWALKKLGGSLAMPRSRAISILLARDLPLMTTVRPRSRARSKTSWMRWMWLENSVTTMRPGASSKTLPRDSMTALSVRERPSRSTLVESENSRRAPSGPAKSRNVARSVPLPARGWGSILKSPLWTMRPTGVSTPKPKPSGMEWHTGKKWKVMSPRATWSPGSTGHSSTQSSSSCSLSLCSTRARVK